VFECEVTPQTHYGHHLPPAKLISEVFSTRQRVFFSSDRVCDCLHTAASVCVTVGRWRCVLTWCSSTHKYSLAHNIYSLHGWNVQADNKPNTQMMCKPERFISALFSPCKPWTIYSKRCMLFVLRWRRTHCGELRIYWIWICLRSHFSFNLLNSSAMNRGAFYCSDVALLLLRRLNCVSYKTYTQMSQYVSLYSISEADSSSVIITFLI